MALYVNNLANVVPLLEQRGGGRETVNTGVSEHMPFREAAEFAQEVGCFAGKV